MLNAVRSRLERLGGEFGGRFGGRLRGRGLRVLVGQLTAFGVVGSLGLVVDVGGFNLLRYAGGEGPLHDHPLTAKLLSGTAAMVVAWLGNRYWTFRERRSRRAHHELLVFVAVSLVGTGIGMACLAVSHHLLGLTSALADNVAANGVGLVLATGFRFWAYRQHVFAPGRDGGGQPPAPPPTGVSAATARDRGRP